MSVDSTDSIKEYTPENRHQKKQKNKLSKTWLADTKKILRKKVRGQKLYTGTCECGGVICCCLWY